MAISLNVRNVALVTTSDATQTVDVTTTAVTSSSKIIVFCGVENTSLTFSSVVFDSGGSYETTLSAVGGNGSPPRVGGPDVLGQLWTANLADSIPTGTYTITVTGSEGFSAGGGGIVAWVLNGADQGALEDVQYDSDATTTDTLTATLTNASTSYVGAALINGASTPTYTWSGVTEWYDANASTSTTSAGDATGSANVVAEVVATSNANDKVMIAWAVAEASAGGGGTLTDTWMLYTSAPGYIDANTIQFGHTFKAALLATGHTLDLTNSVRADLATDIVGTDSAVTLATSADSGMTKVSITGSPSWSGSVSGRYIVVYDDTPTSPADPLLCVVDLGSAQTVGTGFTLSLATGDVFRR
jgi:hypothetical protein